jgi:hypothetical protein
LAIDPITGLVAASAVGSIGGALGGLFGGSSARKAQKEANRANEARYQQALGLHRESRFLTGSRLKKAGERFAAKRGEVMAGYGQARNELETIGRTARTDLLARERTGLRTGEQSLRRRGLYNTSTVEALRRGSRYDTNRALSALDEHIAGVRSNFLVQQAGAMERLGQGEADFEMNAGQIEAQQIQSMINTITGRQDVASPDGGAAAGAQLGAGLGSAASLLLMSYMGGMGSGPATQPAAGMIGPPTPGA